MFILKLVFFTQWDRHNRRSLAIDVAFLNKINQSAAYVELKALRTVMKAVRVTGKTCVLRLLCDIWENITYLQHQWNKYCCSKTPLTGILGLGSTVLEVHVLTQGLVPTLSSSLASTGWDSLAGATSWAAPKDMCRILHQGVPQRIHTSKRDVHLNVTGPSSSSNTGMFLSTWAQNTVEISLIFGDFAGKCALPVSFPCPLFSFLQVFH